jgi:hypothetical protein
MELSQNTINKIIELNDYHNSIDVEAGINKTCNAGINKTCNAGINKTCNAGIIFSIIDNKQRTELMNLFRPKDWFTSPKRINFKKIQVNCKQKIKEIINV